MWFFHTVTGFGPCPHSWPRLHKAMRTLPFVQTILTLVITIYAAIMGHEAQLKGHPDKSIGTTESLVVGIPFSLCVLMFLGFSLQLWDGDHLAILNKYSLYTTTEGSRLRDFSRRVGI